MSEEMLETEGLRLMTQSGEMKQNMDELDDIGADTNYSSKKKSLRFKSKFAKRE